MEQSKVLKQYQDLDYWQSSKLYNKCMDLLNKIYTRWYGSAYGVTHIEVQRLYDLITTGKTSFTRYEREKNDAIYFNQYGEHLYKNMKGKDVSKYNI